MFICDSQKFDSFSLTGDYTWTIIAISWWSDLHLKLQGLFFFFDKSFSSIISDTVRCFYNAVQYNVLLHTTLQKLRQDISQTLHSQNTPYIWPSRASYGVSFVRILEKIGCVIMAPQCIFAADLVFEWIMLSSARSARLCFITIFRNFCSKLFLLCYVGIKNAWHLDMHWRPSHLWT